jgi:hypothetical protein
VGSLLLSAGPTAAAEVVSRVAGAESQAMPSYGFDQVSTHCLESVALRDTTLAYTGEASLAVHTGNDPQCGGPYARGIFQANGSDHLVAGDDFWFGAAIFLPTGFYAAHTGYTDLLRVDSYVDDESESTPFADRAEINFASWNDDDLYVRAAQGGNAVDLIGPLSPRLLSEGTWHWVEVHVDLGASSGSAYTELKIDGRPIGSSTRPNLFVGAEPLNRLRYGIVSTGTAGSGDLTAYFDRASIGSEEQGPAGSASKDIAAIDSAGGTRAAHAKHAGALVFARDLSLPTSLNGIGKRRRARHIVRIGERHLPNDFRLRRAHRARGG